MSANLKISAIARTGKGWFSFQFGGWNENFKLLYNSIVFISHVASLCSKFFKLDFSST